jgi:hypothetical protein
VGVVVDGLVAHVAVVGQIVVVADVELAGDEAVVGRIVVVAGVGQFGAVGRRLGVAAWRTAWFGRTGFGAKVERLVHAVAEAA